MPTMLLPVFFYFCWARSGHKSVAGRRALSLFNSQRVTSSPFVASGRTGM
jgi:hypothetical protein